MSESRIVVPARYDRIRQLCKFVVEAAESAALDKTAVFHCQIAVDEACTNIIEHGYQGEDRGDIELICRTQPGQIEIEICDSGPAFDVTQAPDPQLNKSLDEMSIGGLGIYFMRKTMDDVKYTHTNSLNRLILLKRRAA